MNDLLVPGTHVFKIALSDLPAGMYYCVVRAGDERQTIKLIKL
jgi:hypothetical protein